MLPFARGLRRLTTHVGVALLTAVLIAPATVAAAPKPKEQFKAAPASDESKLDRRLSQRTKKSGDSNVIVEFYDSGEDLTLLNGYGQVGRRIDRFKLRVLRMSNKKLEQLARHPRVKRIVEDRPVSGFNGRTAVTIGSRAVLDLVGYTGAGVGVAVIDSGVAADHVDFAPDGNFIPQGPQASRVVHFKDFVNNLNQQAYDDWGHGTHVAGTVAGDGSASLGRHEGVAPGANIVALKALDGNGVGTISMIIAAIDHAIAMKDVYNIRVINMSLGAGVYESYTTDPLTLAAKRAVDAGIVVVAAAGNLGKAADGSPQYGAITAPGNAPWVITVGASSTMGTIEREDDTIANYSSRGPTMHDYAAKPDLVAPGTGVVSAIAPGSLFYTSKAQYLVPGLAEGLSYTPYLSLSGTSMAAPAVAGTVALMLHANPNLTPNAVKAILQFTAQVYPDFNYLSQGAGFLNARAAVTLAEYFHNGQAGDPYPDMTGWSRHIIWGNYRVFGGVMTLDGTAWHNDVQWGAMATPAGQNIVWGENCDGDGCDNIVWGEDCGGDGCDNIVWGEDCGGADCDNIVWGEDCAECDNIVWGESDGDDNIVWGESCDENGCDNIVWGEAAGDNIVWGEDCDESGCDNIVWGESDDESDLLLIDPALNQLAPSPIDTFESTQWDAMFRHSVDVLNGVLGEVETTTPPPLPDPGTDPPATPPSGAEE